MTTSGLALSAISFQASAKTFNKPVIQLIADDIPSMAETDHKTTERRKKDGRL